MSLPNWTTNVNYNSHDETGFYSDIEVESANKRPSVDNGMFMGYEELPESMDVSGYEIPCTSAVPSNDNLIPSYEEVPSSLKKKFSQASTASDHVVYKLHSRDSAIGIHKIADEINDSFYSDVHPGPHQKDKSNPDESISTSQYEMAVSSPKTTENNYYASPADTHIYEGDKY